MKLLTKAIEERFAKLGKQDVPDPIVVCKFFNPSGAGTWHATSYDPKMDEFFGWVTMGAINDQDAELGYFSHTELREYKGRFGLGIERDLHFEERKLSEVKRDDM
jgi:hypothetical protein